MTTKEMRWRIVGFKHPSNEKSLVYKQNLTDGQLIAAVEQGIVCIDNWLLVDNDDLKVQISNKSDGTSTLTLIVRVSPRTDLWFIWHPSEAQAEFLKQ